MTQFDPSAPGNKRVPEPRAGYEQRKVAHYKFADALTKGWKRRIDDDRKIYDGIDYILCERKVEQEVEVKYIAPIDIPVECLDMYGNPVTQEPNENPDIILPRIAVGESVTIKNNSDSPVFVCGAISETIREEINNLPIQEIKTRKKRVNKSTL